MRDFAMHLFLAAALLSVGCARTPSAPTTSRLEPRGLEPTPADCACPLPVIAQSFVACCLVLPPPAHRHAPLRREGARLSTLFPTPAAARAQWSARAAAPPRLSPPRLADPFPLFEEERGWDLLRQGPGWALDERASLSGLVTSEDGPAGVLVLRVGF